MDVGEPAWTTDTKLFYVGDGLTTGGILVSSGTNSGSAQGTTFSNPLTGNFALFDPSLSGINYTGISGLFYTTGTAGQFYIRGTGNGINIDFYNRILSGNWNSNNLNLSGNLIATTNNLFSTGQNLYNIITGLQVAASLDLVNQSVATTGVLYTPPKTAFFNLSTILAVTTTDSIASVLGGNTGVSISYMNGDNGNPISLKLPLSTKSGTIAPYDTTNDLSTVLYGSNKLYVQINKPILYSIGYINVQGDGRYSAHLRLENLG